MQNKPFLISLKTTTAKKLSSLYTSSLQWHIKTSRNHKDLYYSSVHDIFG